MSRAAQPLPETNPEREPHENTGRYAIDSSARGGTMIPPADDSTGELLSLEELGGALIENKPRTQPPPTPPQAMNSASGVVPAKTADPDAVFAERLISLRPIYDPPADAKNERAVIDIEDLTLRPDNPYLASSLVPPAETTGTSKKVILGGVAVMAAAAALFVLARPAAAPVVRPAKPAASARSAATPKRAPEPAQPAAATVEATAPAVEAEVAASTAPVTPAETAVPADEKSLLAVEARQAASAEATEPAKQVAPKAAQAAAAEPAPAAATAEPTAAVPAPTQPAPSAAAPSEQTAAPAPAAPAASAEALPETLTRGQVVDGFDSVRPALEQCAAGQHGVAKINVTIANTGRVSYALVDGAFAGTPEGSCMARAVRAAKFPSFSQPSLKVSYPVAF